MEVREARTLLKASVLTKATIFRVYSSDGPLGWSIRFEATKDIGASMILETQLKADRVFKTADAALLALGSIGFDVATIIDILPKAL